MECPIFAKLPTPLVLFCPILLDPPTPPKIGHHLCTFPNSEIICGQNVGTKVVCGMILFFEKKAMLKI